MPVLLPVTRIVVPFSRSMSLPFAGRRCRPRHGRIGTMWTDR
jgi:hypothetical protein